MRFKIYDFEIVNLNSQTSQNNELIEYVNEYEVSNDKTSKVRKCLIIKYIFFFILSILFLLFLLWI